MQAKKWLILTLLLPSLVLFVGCGPEKGIVSGEVTVDGHPLLDGDICFTPADKNGDSVAAKIRDGKYEVAMVVGKKSVQISMPVVVEKRKESPAPNAPWIEIKEEGLPARFNTATQLTYEVTPGNNVKSWNLTKKPEP